MSDAARRAMPRLRLVALPGLAALAGLGIAQALLEPPRGELLDLALYFGASGLTTLAAGRAILVLAERRSRLSLQRRSLLVAALGPVIVLANVYVIAALMFVSTGHDLGLLVSVIVFSGGLGLILASWSASLTARQVEVVHSALKDLEEGRGHAWVGKRGAPDELHSLAARVSALATRLDAAEIERQSVDRQRRDLTAAISHDLRTPLASIRVMVEALSDGVVAGEDDLARYHAAIGREVERLSRMVDDLLEMAQIDGGVLGLDRQVLPVDEIAAEVVSAMQVQAANAGLTLRYEAPLRPRLAFVDGGRIERALANLIRNAMEHTAAGGEVTVTVTGDTDDIVVRVADTGSGIGEREQPLIWDRFYRGDSARTRGDGPGGTGLGLSIVRGFVEAHGGSVAVSSTRGLGSTFTVRLPPAPFSRS